MTERRDKHVVYQCDCGTGHFVSVDQFLFDDGPSTYFSIHNYQEFAEWDFKRRFNVVWELVRWLFSPRRYGTHHVSWGEVVFTGPEQIRSLAGTLDECADAWERSEKTVQSGGNVTV